MTDLLPPDVIVMELADGIRYRLPLRKRGGFVWMGLGHLIGGGVGIAFMSFWLYAVTYHIDWRAPFAGPEAFLLFFVAAGLFHVDADVVVGGPRHQPAGRAQRNRGARRVVARLRMLGPPAVELAAAVRRPGPLRGAARQYGAGCHQVLCQRLRSVRLPRHSSGLAERRTIAGRQVETPGLGYPRDWLVLLAQELARRCWTATELPRAAQSGSELSSGAACASSRR